MKHSEYIKLTSLLNGMSGNADTLRLLFSRTDQAKQQPDYRIKHILLDREEKAVHETLDLMDRTVDGWTDENQARTDQGLEPTADCRKLYLVMSGFMDATETPVAGAAGLYDRIRKHCRAWMDQAVTWFPDLIDNQGENDQETGPTSTTGHGKIVTVKVNRERFANCFNDEFKKKRPGQAYSRFDKLCHAMTTVRFTKTDWGRIAFAIKWYHQIVTNRVQFMDFSKWLVEFYEIIGLEPPKDTRQNKYKNPAGTRPFITNFLY